MPVVNADVACRMARGQGVLNARPLEELRALLDAPIGSAGQPRRAAVSAAVEPTDAHAG